jgi:hypothetical protein
MKMPPRIGGTLFVVVVVKKIRRLERIPVERSKFQVKQ